MKILNPEETKRKMELLAYAVVCFENCTSPFAQIHILKKMVNADECKDLSKDIAEALEERLYAIADQNNHIIYNHIAKEIQEARIHFEETQKCLI